jgi:hypothetical protein
MVTPKESVRVAKPVQATQYKLQAIKSDVHYFTMTSVAREKGFVPEHQPIMSDFEVVKHEDNLNRFYITLLLEMDDSRNTEYVLSFRISTVTEFEYCPKAYPTPIPTDEAQRWTLFYSAVNTAVAIARGYLTTYLAHTPYRDYMLPLLDSEELISRKYARPTLPEVPSTAPSEKPPLKPKKPKE